MKQMVTFLLGAVIATAFAAASFGQTTDPGATDKNAPATQPSSSAQTPNAATPATPAPDATKAPDATAQPAQTAPAPASEPAKSNPAMDRINERGAKASAKMRADVEKKLDEIEKQVENEAQSKGDAAVAGRIATEFGLTADAFTAEKAQYGRGYGELVIAHTLLANAKTDATMADLFALRSQGAGWGVIAAGLDLKLGEVVPAVRSEGRVAMGLEKSDGKAALIHVAAAGSTKTKAASKPAAAKGEAKAGASAEGAGVGVGGGVDINKATGK